MKKTKVTSEVTLSCSKCGWQFVLDYDKCDECKQPFKLGDEIYCDITETGEGHYCKECGKELKEKWSKKKKEGE